MVPTSRSWPIAAAFPAALVALATAMVWPAAVPVDYQNNVVQLAVEHNVVSPGDLLLAQRKPFRASCEPLGCSYGKVR